jgi:methyl-accepting chemotaxis protein
MKSNIWQAFILVCAAAIALLFVKLMYDMSANMAQMTNHVGSLSRDVSAMKNSMDSMSADMSKMSESVQRMDSNIQAMGDTFGKSTKTLQQWDPTQIMR